MTRYLIIGFLATLCCCLQTSSADDAERLIPDRFLSWQSVETHPARGVFLVIHGLNAKPETMNSLKDLLHSAGYHTVLLTLAGHEKNESTKHSAREEVWNKQINLSYQLAKKRFPNLPVSVLAYSLGGALSVNAIDSYDNFSPENLVLIAPAIDIVWTANLLYPALWLRNFDLSLPSLAPKSYAAHDSVSLHAYHGLLSVNSKVNNLSHPEKLRAVKTLVIQNPHDGLVNTPGLKQWIDKYSLESWDLLEVNPQPTTQDTIPHIIIDKQSLGPKEWERMGSAIKNHIS